MSTPVEMIPVIRKYALENYEKNGWDVLVECWEDKDILEAIGNTSSLEVAIKKIGRILKVGHDQMIDSWADGGLCTVCASPDHDAKDCPAKGSR